jgi:hypothetical protein
MQCQEEKSFFASEFKTRKMFLIMGTNKQDAILQIAKSNVMDGCIDMTILVQNRDFRAWMR